MSKFGYVRVSSKDQNEDRQVIALTEAGVPENRIYIDKQSGKDFERAQYRRLFRRLHRGDCLIVKSIDRLGRDYDEIIQQWRVLTKVKGVDIAILDMPLLDTRRKETGLLDTFIADIVLQILSYVAQTEREYIRQRQREGIDAAIQKGIRLGRPPLPVPAEFPALREAWIKGELSLSVCARILNVSRPTFKRWCGKADGARLLRG